MLPLLPDEDKNFGGSLVLDFRNLNPNSKSEFGVRFLNSE